MYLPYFILKDKMSCAYRTLPTLSFDDPDLQAADVVILQRQHEVKLLEMIQKLKDQKIFVFEIDDNYWALEHEYVTEYWTQKRLSNMEDIISECHAVTTSTEPLAQVLSKFNPNVYLIPSFAIDPHEPPKLLRKKPGVVRRGWAGGTAHRHIY